jgi:hypothetical protein
MSELKPPSDRPDDNPPVVPTPPSETDRLDRLIAAKGLDAPRTNPDGSWDWKGRHLTPEANETADRTLARLRAVEPDISATMKALEAQLPGAALGGFENRLKTTDRFKERLAEWTEERPNRPPEVTAARIYDGVRYTFVLQPDQYAQGVRDACAKFADAGYEPRRIWNAWSQDQYRGINTRWRSPGSGPLVEVQFHTPQSFEAKQRTHDAYEKLMDPRTPTAEKERLERYQREVSATVEIPPGAPDIQDYPRKGRR